MSEQLRDDNDQHVGRIFKTGSNIDVSDISHPHHYSCECGVTIRADTSDPHTLSRLWCPKCGDKMEVEEGWLLRTKANPCRHEIITTLGNGKVWLSDGSSISILKIKEDSTMVIE